MEPLLSIIIPSYNYACFLPQALDSILGQDFKEFEILLLDDGSTDSSPEISALYAQKESRIRYYRNIKNGGLFLRAQEGLDLAKGTYIHFFSADDLYLSGFLSKSMQMLFQTGAGLVSSDIGYFYENGQKKIVKLLADESEALFFSPKEVTLLFQTKKFWIAGTSTIAKKELIVKHGGYIPKLENISDWFLYHKMALLEGVAYLPENLLDMRQHPSTYSNQVKKDKKRRRKTYTHLLEILNKDPLIREKFREAKLLDFALKDLSWRLFLKPSFLTYLT